MFTTTWIEVIRFIFILFAWSALAAFLLHEFLGWLKKVINHE